MLDKLRQLLLSLKSGINRLNPNAPIEGSLNAPRYPTPTTGPTSTPTMPQPTMQPKSPVQEYARTETTPSKSYSAKGRNPKSGDFRISESVVDAIKNAANMYGVPEELMYDIAMQESSFDPGRRAQDWGFPDSTAAGLFMFNDPTWQTVQNYAGMPGSSLQLPQNANKMDPNVSALAAAYLIANGQLGRWDASKNVWGQYYSDEDLEPFYSQSGGGKNAKSQSRR